MCKGFLPEKHVLCISHIFKLDSICIPMFNCFSYTKMIRIKIISLIFWTKIYYVRTFCKGICVMGRCVCVNEYFAWNKNDGLAGCIPLKIKERPLGHVYRLEFTIYIVIVNCCLFLQTFSLYTSYIYIPTNRYIKINR